MDGEEIFFEPLSGGLYVVFEMLFPMFRKILLL